MTYCYSNARKKSLATDVWATIQCVLVGIASYKMPLMAVGNREFHRVFYFSEKAFYNIFVVHLKLFDEIEFENRPCREMGWWEDARCHRIVLYKYSRFYYCLLN